MTMNTFTTYAKDHIKDYLPPEYAKASVILDTVNKLDDQYLGLIVQQEEDSSSPIANLDRFFQQLETSASLEEVMAEMAHVVQMKLPYPTELDDLQDYETVKSKLFIRLSMVSASESVMQKSPHRIIGDMLMTYHILLDFENDGGVMSARITNDLLDTYEITETVLYRDALMHSPASMRPKIQSMQEALIGIPEDDPVFLVISNEASIFGAGAIFHPGVMEEVARLLGGSYFVIPSSVHEMLAVVDNGNFTVADLQNMLIGANATVVRPDEILSECIYHYDARNQLFETAND